MKQIYLPLAAIISLIVLFDTSLNAQVPQIIHYQSRIAVNGVNFEGNGQFKFALVNSNAATTYWSNDGTSTAPAGQVVPELPGDFPPAVPPGIVRRFRDLVKRIKGVKNYSQDSVKHWASKAP